MTARSLAPVLALAFTAGTGACGVPRAAPRDEPPPYAPTDDELAVHAAALDAWAFSGHWPPRAGCVDEPLRIVYVDSPRYGAQYLDPYTHTIVLPTGSPLEAAVHEYMHVMYVCTYFDPDDPQPFGKCALAPGVPDYYDYCHRYPGASSPTARWIWRDYPVENPGGVNSAQYVAEWLLGGSEG